MIKWSFGISKNKLSQAILQLQNLHKVTKNYKKIPVDTQDYIAP